VLNIDLPFSVEAFFGVFERYNSELPYAGVVIASIAIVSTILSLTSRWRLSLLILAGLWLWAGVAYHFIYFSAINPAAYWFGAFFLLQASLLAITALRPIRLEPAADRSGATGLAIVIFSILVYPLLGYWTGHVFPRSPTFGLPCPLTIFTFGTLLLLPKRVPKFVVIIPLIWAVIGTTASLLFGVWQDLALLISAVTFVMIRFVLDPD
jgi:Family of unknown function (DUF6064)